MCQILIWNLEIGEPVKMIDCHTDVILSMSFNTDGSLLATSCKDKKLRVIEPRSGGVLQVTEGRALCSCTLRQQLLQLYVKNIINNDYLDVYL